VANYLETLGVRSSRIDAVGYGESQPRATNSTANGRQLNRRVEIHIRANS
jgi:outer membrane protein OmpA-like peptidoglycan-associated protein